MAPGGVKVLDVDHREYIILTVERSVGGIIEYVFL